MAEDLVSIFAQLDTKSVPLDEKTETEGTESTVEEVQEVLSF